GVFQSTGGADHRHGSVAQAVDLVQSAGFVAAGHEEHVCAGLYAMGERVVVSEFDGNAARIAGLEGSEQSFHLFFAIAEGSEIHILSEDLIGSLANQIEAFLGGKPGDDANEWALH